MLFNRGIPTEIDVNALMQKFGVPSIGTVVKYEAISAVIDQPADSNRWYAVVMAWRKKLDRESNVIFRAIPNVGFEALDGAGRVDVAGRIYKAGLRRVGRSSRIAMRTDRTGLTPEQRKVADHLQNAAGVIALAAATEAKRLALPEAAGNGNGKG